MNLFKFLKRDKPVVATEAAPVEVAKPETPAAPVHTRRWQIKVPVGYVFPESEIPITQPFDITVEAGIRWHPEWQRPRVTVNVWRFFPAGDAVGWAGGAAVRSFGPLLPAEVKELAEFHGQFLSDLGDYGREALEKLKVEAPKVQQLLSTFIDPRQRGEVA